MKATFAALWLGLAAFAAAATEANRANLAELEAVRGLGPELAARLLAERERALFRNWADLQARVKGLGPRAALKLSEAGLRVDGAAHPARAASAP